MNAMDFTLRAYTPTDNAAILRLFRETVHSVCLADYTPAQVDAWASHSLDADAFCARFLTDYTLVAETGGVMAGFASLKNNGYFDMLYVHKDFQRMGIARALADALEARGAAALGLTEIRTDASITARGFFETRGYAVQKQNAVASAGQLLTNYTMVKHI